MQEREKKVRGEKMVNHRRRPLDFHILKVYDNKFKDASKTNAKFYEKLRSWTTAPKKITAQEYEEP